MILGAWLIGSSLAGQGIEGTWGITWDRRATEWSPDWFTGELVLGEGADGSAAGTVQFRQARETFPLQFRSATAEDLRFVATNGGKGGGEFRGFVDGDALHGWMRWDPMPWAPVHGWRTDTVRTDASARTLPVATPEAVGLDPAAVDRFLAAAQVNHASGVALACDGSLVVARAFDGKRASIQSITKVMAAMAVPFLVEDGAITLDTPLGEVLPKWSGRAGTPTLRHVMTHTTGLANDPDARKVVNPAPDKVQLALDAAQEAPAGTVHAYNNTAMALIPAVVAELSGERLDTWLQARVFDALGFTPDWAYDSVGTPGAYGGMWLNAAELASVGQLFLDGGKRGDRQVLPEGWAERMLSSNAPAAVKRSGMGLQWMKLADDAWGHTGSGGQALVLFPAEGCVVARTHVVAEDPGLGHEAWDVVTAGRAALLGRKR